jgi:hypothetical protein
VKKHFLKGLLIIVSLGPLDGYSEVKFTGKYEQNFDSLIEAEKFPETKTQDLQTNFGQMPDWQLAKIAGPETSAVTLNIDSGKLGYGAIYSYGHEGDSNRSLGSISTGNISTAFGLALVNSTGKTIEKVSISFDAEIWRNPTRAPTALLFSYGLSGGQIKFDNYLSSTDMILHEDLNVLGPVTGRDAQPVDGKAEFNRVPISGFITNLQWKPGEKLFLRWANPDGPGSCSGTAMDNFVIQAN